MDKVLLVEDNDALIEIYSIIFKHQNFNIEVAINGEEALQRVKTFNPDIILMDVMMPKLNGIQTLEKLKADELTKNIPVLMLSNIADSEQEKKASSLGAAGYLIKSHYLPLDVVKITKDTILKHRLENPN